MEKKDYYYCQSGTNGNENVYTALFTAGIVLLLVCLKRALLLFLVEQWRAWVFLVLNIVLLAIFFTSMNPNSSQISHQEVSMKNGSEVEACKEDQLLKSKKRSKTEEAEEKLEKEVVVEEENGEPPKLSKEELNERVEAFIAMFRQHLALDARKGRDKFYTERKQADMKKKHINLSSDEQKCFVLKVQGCDRILWYGKGVKLLSYFRSEIKFSDHRPVSALFSTQIEVMKFTNPRFVDKDTIVPNIMTPEQIGTSRNDEEGKSTLLSLIVKDTEASSTHAKTVDKSYENGFS